MIDDPLVVIGQPAKQQGELLEVLVDGGRALARIQQPILEHDHISLAVACRRSVPHNLDKGAEIVLLILPLLGCPREGLFLLIAVTQD
ncbi:hypothetical protein D3C77_509060 [compost metagenome]